MKSYAKLALAAARLRGAAVTASAPAEAHVGMFLNLGIPAPVYAPAYAPPAYQGCYGPAYYSYCAYPVYADPVFWNGIRYNNAPYRVVRGRHEFWVHGGWHDARPGMRGHVQR